MCSSRNVRKQKRAVATSPSGKYALDSTQNARSENVKTNLADRSRDPAVNLDVPWNKQNEKTAAWWEGSKRKGNRVGKKLDWSHVKSRTDCYLRRKPTMQETKYNEFIGGKMDTHRSAVEYIDEETGKFQCDKHISLEKSFQLLTIYTKRRDE